MLHAIEQYSFASLCRTSAFSRSTTRLIAMTRAAFPTVSSVSWMPACLLSSVLRTLEARVSKRYPYTPLTCTHAHTQTHIHIQRMIDCTATTMNSIQISHAKHHRHNKGCMHATLLYSLSHASARERMIEEEEERDPRQHVVGGGGGGNMDVIPRW